MEAERSASEAARELGINVNSLYNWLSTLRDKSLERHTKDDILAEHKRLKKELAQASLERDILKKAAAYFAKGIL